VIHFAALVNFTSPRLSALVVIGTRRTTTLSDIASAPTLAGDQLGQVAPFLIVAPVRLI
jgi:hypothetical protein